MQEERRTIERYELCDRIGSGGMGVVHLGHLHGSAGFRRIVAIKRLHAELVSDREFVRAFVEEARLAARIRHPNVVPILDTISDEDELFLVLEYIHGETLHRLMSLREHHPPPIGVSAAIVRGVLEGLYAAHTATNELGAPLEIVHRDISPQNILVGVDGVPRVLDFGVATASGKNADRKGKPSYMAPEQIISGETSPRSDVYSAAVVLWEALTGRRLFKSTMPLTLHIDVELRPPSSFNCAVTKELDHVVMRGLERNPALRYASAREMSVELEQATVLATMREIGHWVDVRAGKLLRRRAERIATIERGFEPATDAAVDADGTPLPAFHEFDDLIDTTTEGGPFSKIIITQKHQLDWTAIPTLASPVPLELPDLPDEPDLVPTQKGTVVPAVEEEKPRSFASLIALASLLVVLLILLAAQQPSTTQATPMPSVTVIEPDPEPESESDQRDRPRRAHRRSTQDLRKPNRSNR